MSYVYLFGPHVPHEKFMWHKIGFSINPVAREKQLVEMPVQCQMILSVFTEDMRALERALHKFLDYYRGNGEWFFLPTEIIDNFQQLCFFLIEKEFKVPISLREVQHAVYYGELTLEDIAKLPLREWNSIYEEVILNDREIELSEAEDFIVWYLKITTCRASS